MTERKQSIVLLDLWTDANRGDCALQLGLIGMVRERWPQARVFGVFRFGTNEMSTALAEAGITAAALDGHCGGLRRTYYSATNLNRHGRLAAKLISLFSFVEAFAWLCLYKLRLPGIPRAKKQVMDELANADVVIWKGKNFRDYGGLAGINRQMTLLSAGMLGTSLNRNVHCVNASVWAMRNRIERWLVQRTFSRCRSLTVREPTSYDVLRSVNLPGVQMFFAQDLSFYCLRHQFAANGQRRTPTDTQYDVAFTVTRWGDATAQMLYLETLRECLRSLTAAGARRFVVVPQVTRAAEDSSELVAVLTSAVAPGSGASIELVEGSPEIGPLLDIYERSALLIGTRMHSCVFAMAVGTPFVAIAYDAGPKWDILKQFWPAEFIFEYGSPGTEVAAAASRLFMDRGIARAAAERFAPLAAESFSNVKHIT